MFFWRFVFEGHRRSNGALNAKVLLLNQSYEPLTICNVKKAMILMFLGKAELVSDNNQKAIRTVAKIFPWPSVIRLKSYIKLPYKKIILTRKNILKRDGHRCGYCGRGDLPLTIDHIIPKSRGGDDSWENLVSACLPCNNKKGDQTPEEANISLKVKPYIPNHIMFIRNTVSRLDDNWKPYLFQA
ncbi:MAG: HNH endonuclease [Ignavibacteria bacterium RBG_13_36_8]|nr:MAG: HNH endonuclease [Ignavibacteria bacterium RBG_13_36_8]